MGMADQTLAKAVNERAILTLLRRQGMASRAEIARALGVTPATITRLTSDMMARGLLRAGELAAPGTLREPGRPGLGVEIDPQGGYFLGIELGVTVLRAVLIDLRGGVVARQERPIPRGISPRDAAGTIAEIVRGHQADPRCAGRILGAGVTVPGLVTHDGHIVNLPILGWTQTGFRAELARVTDLAFDIENNANAAAFAAHYTQPEMGAESLLFLKLGTGCGGAVIARGRLLRGAQGTGMELGHLNIGAQGVVCGCGQRGCLETWVNLAALARIFLGREPLSDETLTDLPDQVALAHAQGAPRALAAVESLASHLGQGLVSLVNIFNPSHVLLGGVLRPVLALCLPQLRATLAARVIPGMACPAIDLSALGVFECAIGAACLAHSRAFDLPQIEIG